MTAGVSVTVASGTTAVTGPGAVTIGRDHSSDIVVDDPLVSRVHARLAVAGGRWVLSDANSRNGVFFDGARVSTVTVDRAVTVRLGDAVAGPWVQVSPLEGAAPVDEGVAPGKLTAVHDARSGVVRIGRAAENDIVLDDLLVSRFHAELHRDADGRARAVDLGSHNGTFVNGQPVADGPLGPEDLLTIGSRLFRLRDGRLVEYADSGVVGFTAVGLHVGLDGGRVLLDRVSFALDPSSFLGVVGPSGAGKSTLLGALTGFRPADGGSVTYGGRDMYRDYDALRRRIGYVPQDDLVHPDLTVAMSLRYAAKLRFPPDVGADERDRRVDQVLDELDLEHRRDLPVRLLSGGQRKRVSVALELLTEPSLLFLDEPTSGLDPGLERSVMQLLRDLADRGRIVVCVTHSVESLHLCDRVLCLAPGGRMAWFGPPQLACAHFRRADFQEVFQDLAAGDPDHVAAKFAATDAHRRYVTEPLSGARAPDVATPPERHAPVRGWWRQFSTNTARYARSMAADRANLLYMAAMAPVLGLVLLLRLPPDQLDRLPAGEFHLFSQAAAPLLLLTLATTQLGMAFAAREVVKELPIFKRERAVGLSISAYLGSKLVVLSAVGVAETLVLVAITLARQRGPADGAVLADGHAELVLVFGATWVAGIALGLMMSSLSVSENRLALVLPAVIGLHSIAATGVALPGVPSVPVLDQTAYVSSAAWGFKAAASTVRLNELQAFNDAVRDLPLDGARGDPEGAARRALDRLARTDPETAERLGDPNFNHSAGAWSRAMIAIGALIIASLIGAGLALRRYDPL
ncbi:MAG: FHA domain-containing protein [Acidimicrobiia bacterium]